MNKPDPIFAPPRTSSHAHSGAHDDMVDALAYSLGTRRPIKRSRWKRFWAWLGGHARDAWDCLRGQPQPPLHAIAALIRAAQDCLSEVAEIHGQKKHWPLEVCIFCNLDIALRDAQNALAVMDRRHQFEMSSRIGATLGGAFCDCQRHRAERLDMKRPATIRSHGPNSERPEDP